MSELLDKQVYVQFEILKIVFRKPTKKVCKENESRKKRRPRNIFLWLKEEFIRLYLKSGRTDFNKLQDTVSTLNEGTNSVVTRESEPDGWFVVRRCKTRAIKFAMAGSQDCTDFLNRWCINSI